MPLILRHSTLTIKTQTIPILTFFSYLLDWIFYLIITTLSIIYIRAVLPAFHEFLLQDTNLMYSYKTEAEIAIPLWLLVVLAIGMPFLQFIFCSTINYRTLSTTRIIWDINAGLLALLGSMSCQLMFVCLLKNICGLPRPDMLSRCQPASDVMEKAYTLSSIDICTTSDTKLLEEGFRSFPSAHLSTIFCGMTISSLNMAAKLQIFDKRGLSCKVVLAILPMAIACMVSCTRISDNSHFLRDVVWGSLIGAVIGAWFYLQYFPSVFDLENGGRAYPPRRFGVSKFFNNVGGFWKIHDSLPGSFDNRTLNNVNLLPKFRELGESFDEEEVLNIDANIKLMDDLSSKIPMAYINLGEETV